VEVPDDWNVPLGAYPVGLFWGLANEFSRDAGLDLTPLKGETVQVLRYSLAGGLPAEGNPDGFRYPSDVILLVREQKVVGAWLSFNTTAIGPSVKKRYLGDITGLTFGQWVERGKYFADSGNNGDLAALNPGQVLGAFCQAIDQGNRTRAEACLDPRALLDSLTVNMDRDNRLYNPDFGPNNSLVDNMVSARLIYYEANILTKQGKRPTVQLAARLALQWRDPAFNHNPGGQEVRFVIFRQYANGWKMDNLNTGP
jgi:hypothetical protein